MPNPKFSIFNFQFSIQSGFSLIELMVVVTLFGIAASLVTASYLTFERNQRIKSAAVQLKNELRLIQNKATSGDKGPGAAICEANADTLGGWYLRISKGDISFSYAGVCADNNWANEVTFSSKSVSLPNDVKVGKIFHSLSTDVTRPVAILFRPLKTGVEFFDADLVASGFFDDVTGASITGKYIIPAPSGTVSIELSNTDGNRCYLVKIESSGEISDEKPLSCSI